MLPKKKPPVPQNVIDAVREARVAAFGDSNDAEIDLLVDALDAALTEAYGVTYWQLVEDVPDPDVDGAGGSE